MSAPYTFDAPLTDAPLPKTVEGNDYTTLMMILGIPVNMAVAVLFVNGLMALGHGNSVAFWFGGVTLLVAYLVSAFGVFFMSFDAGLDYEIDE